MAAEERYMKMSAEEKKRWMDQRKHNNTPNNSFYQKPGPGRENECFEKASTRRAAGVYVQNY